METVDVHGTAGAPIELPIGGGPATGYEWMVELPDGVRRVEDGEPTVPGADVWLGTGTGSRVRVIATAGEHVVRARLVQPWDARAVDEVRLVLHVAAAQRL